MGHPEGRVHGQGGQHHQDCPQMAWSRGPLTGETFVFVFIPGIWSPLAEPRPESQRFPSQRVAAPAGPPVPGETHAQTILKDAACYYPSCQQTAST